MKSLFLILTMVVSISGCAGFSGYPKEPFKTELQIESTRDAFDKNTYKQYYYSNTPEKDKLQIRDKVVNQQIRAYDIRFAEYERDLFKTGICFGLGTDWASLALSGLTATVGGATVKAALGAANAGIVGVKGTIDKQMFMEKTLPIILTEIHSQRAAVLLQIRRGLSQNNINVYGLDHGLSDVMRYADAGSIAAGLNGILASSGAKLKSSQDELNKLNERTTFNYLCDESCVKLKAFWMPDKETVDATNKAKLEKLMKAEGLDTGPGKINSLITSADFADYRVLFVSILNL